MLEQRNALASHWLVGHGLRSRLNSLTLVFALLPIFGIAIAVYAIETTKANHTDLERATTGALLLERINGLVYAVVMESRGIYMSADSAAAEPFAKRLEQQLAILERVAAEWRRIAIEGQRTNADELSRRIEQFANFRTELVRLGREVGTPAARAFGDNAANRNVRTALNESLQALAKSYEAEIDRIQSRMVNGEQTILVRLALLAGIAIFALFVGVAIIRRGLLSPLLRMKEAMILLASGRLDIEITSKGRLDEIGEMARTIAIFHANSLERRRMNRESKLLSSLNEWLQSSKSLDELYSMVGEFLTRLLPGCSGSLYVYANSRDVLESAWSWNGVDAPGSIHPDDCWSLRRGRTYTYGEEEVGFACSHYVPDDTTCHCCIPILAHGETIGLLHLVFARDTDAAGKRNCEVSIAEQRRLGTVCAEQISLAIANVKLRDQLRDQSIRDSLTGLYNRRYLIETCRREFSRAGRTGEQVAVLSLDVDHFKRFNDNHGHDAGDTVLRAVGECLDTAFRDEDVACRFGGEEFVVILPGADADTAVRRAEELRAKVEGLVVRYLNANLPSISASIGVATYPEQGQTPQDVLKAADAALYAAKAAGRNCVRRADAAPTAAPAGDSPVTTSAVVATTPAPSSRRMLATACCGDVHRHVGAHYHCSHE